MKTSATNWTWTVPAEGTTERADLAILSALSEIGAGTEPAPPPTCSRSQLRRLIDEGHVTENGVPIKSNVRLKPGARIEIRFPAPRALQLTPEDRPLEILFEDDHLVVVNKPPGLTVHPSATQAEGTLVHVLLHHIKNLSGIGGVLRPGIVHRIDKDTSGALVITKTDAAHQALVETFSRHEIDRVYWALCYGSPAEPKGRIETLIGRNPKDRKKMTTDVKEGRKAVTHYRRVEEYGVPRAKAFGSWLEVTLETGRTHQVRVHLTGLGHSLLGDPVYGKPSERHPKWLALPEEVKKSVLALRGQALHARVLGFKHPVTGETLRFEAEPPAAFAALLRSLQKFN